MSNHQLFDYEHIFIKIAIEMLWQFDQNNRFTNTLSEGVEKLDLDTDDKNFDHLSAREYLNLGYIGFRGLACRDGLQDGIRTILGMQKSIYDYWSEDEVEVDYSIQDEVDYSIQLAQDDLRRTTPNYEDLFAANRKRPPILDKFLLPINLRSSGEGQYVAEDVAYLYGQAIALKAADFMEIDVPADFRKEVEAGLEVQRKIRLKSAPLPMKEKGVAKGNDGVDDLSIDR